MRSKFRKSSLLKTDQLQYIESPSLQGHVVQHSNAYCLLIIDGIVIPCSPIEYALLICLLRHEDGCVPLESLAQSAFQSSLNRQIRHRLTQHMGEIRGKLWPFGLELFCVMGFGYKLQAKPDTQKAPAQEMEALVP